MIARPPDVRRPLATAGVLVTALLAAVDAGAQQRPVAAIDKYTDEWRAAAQAHVGATFDAPAASIARWPDELTRQVIDRAVEQFQRALKGEVADRAAVIAKGLLLHTDIGIAQRTGKAEPAGTVDPVLLDAMPLASRRFSVHWRHAGVLADALRKSHASVTARDGTPNTTTAIALTWYRAASALFQLWADLGHLDAHLGDAEARLGEDPVLLLYQGTLHQTYADARLQLYRARLSGPPSGLPGDTMGSSVVVMGSRLPFGNARTELAAADRALRRALALDGSLVEARIRLAHVQDALGKPAEAAALARQALAETLPAFLEYYAAMILGRAEASLGHPLEARAAFERAAARYPRSQATQVALSHVPLYGSQGIAAEALVPALGPDGQDVENDPWAWYFRLHAPDAPSLYEALRASVP
jgi:tetratricopeptide (TPR) repeat protein